MSVFDNVYSGTKKAADKIGKITSEAVEYSKIKFAIANLKDKLQGRYKILGMMYYQSVKNETAPDESAELTISEIDGILGEIEEKKEQLAKLKNTSKCSSCGANNPKGSEYCCKCGSKLD